MEILNIKHIDDYLKDNLKSDDFLNSVIEKMSSSQPEILRYLCSVESNRFNDYEMNFFILSGVLVGAILENFFGEISFISPRMIRNFEKNNLKDFNEFLDENKYDISSIVKFLSQLNQQPNVFMIIYQYYNVFNKIHYNEMREENYLCALIHLKTIADCFYQASKKSFFKEKTPVGSILSEAEKNIIKYNFNLKENSNLYFKEFADENSIKKTGRNDPCPCGSGLKFKKCCGKY